MSALVFVQLLSSAIGIITAILITSVRRIGRNSWILALFLIPCSLSSSALALADFQTGWSVAMAFRLSFSLLVAAAPLGAFASYMVGREEHPKLPVFMRVLAGVMVAAAPVGIFWICSFPPPAPHDLPPGNHALGPGGYFGAVLIVLVCIFALANLEKTLRCAQEHIRWEIKFLLLGLAGTFGAMLYISSKVLRFPSAGLVPLASLRMFPILFLCSCFLILVSWKRSSGRWRVAVSPGIVYNSIALISIGVYLIISGIIARWAGHWSSPEVSIDAALFLILLLVLVVFLLWTDFRHRVKHWIRRHLLSGNYDYRQYWLEASDRVRSIDPAEVAASELAGIVHGGLGAIDVSVWLRMQNPKRLKLLAVRGNIGYPLAIEVYGIVEKLFDIENPITIDDLKIHGADAPMHEFLAQTKTSVLVPLQSSGRVVGLLTVGPDRSGQPYDWDALEFLGVLGKHAAGELHKTDLLSTLVEAKESEAFRTFSTFLLHDLKNFASTLSLIAKNASRYQDNPDFQRDAFQSILETAEKMKRLCNSLRTFSNTAANKKPSNLNQIARAVADNFSGDLSNRLILDLDELPLVSLDSEEIERVLRNLLLNAREAIPPEGTITLRTRNQGNQVEVTVEDNGRGMKPEFIEKELFVPFHTTKSDGLGIGLYQSKKIMDAHEGAIRVESKEGLGTVVRLFFPLTRAVHATGKRASLSSLGAVEKNV
jgi:putative PEP-CTERM system histidine kinase